uniref:Uncharacterized protein n=1 Tax=viral metagenome TaxID=1070528 RepID=A0A6C0M0I8_9ZZZZ
MVLDTHSPTASVPYPAFNECSGYTLDPFWIDVLENCAKGRFPKGFRVSPKDPKTMMYIPHGSKRWTSVTTGIDTTQVNTDDAAKYISLYTEMMSIMRDSPKGLCMRSQGDISTLKSLTTNSASTKRTTKACRERTICEYVHRMADVHGLTTQNRIQLLNTIKLVFLLSNSRSECADIVTYDGDGLIADIESLRVEKDANGNVIGFCVASGVLDTPGAERESPLASTRVASTRVRKNVHKGCNRSVSTRAASVWSKQLEQYVKSYRESLV